ncbi:hypothetical protein K2173_022375 [Erythroxylum novogranatense]|uniref:B-like cyclin n=1 Tax=Erythroxylum novogranatense TaxID=1862640 RepID=A0AAV8THG2_9ROSI|nr:hypothetical protein K2173_022375 [Erythroxylum novogranatense]
MSNSLENRSDHQRYTFYGEPHHLPVSDTAILALLDSELHSMPQPDYIDRYSNDFYHLFTRRICFRWIHQLIHLVIKLEEKHMKILAAACLSIAVKMEETKGPKKLLNELRLLCRDVIPLKSIQKVESSVANKLSWKLLSVTPFNYIRNFIIKLPSSSYNGPDNVRIVQDSCHLILNSLMDIESLAFTPSTVAAAAVELASAKYFKARSGDEGEDGHFFHPSVKKEKVRECISLMRKINPR